MKKALAIILLLTVLLLSACGSNSTEQVSSVGPVTQVTEATETQPTESTMMPENTTEAANNSFSQPVTEPSETTGPTVPEETSKPTTPTEPKEETPKDPPPTTKPTEETQPSTTEPETQPTLSQITPLSLRLVGIPIPMSIISPRKILLATVARSLGPASQTSGSITTTPVAKHPPIPESSGMKRVAVKPSKTSWRRSSWVVTLAHGTSLM